LVLRISLRQHLWGEKQKPALKSLTFSGDWKVRQNLTAIRLERFWNLFRKNFSNADLVPGGSLQDLAEKACKANYIIPVVKFNSKNA